jgi:hypothetical protein
MIRAQQPGSQPIDIPETIPNPAVVPVQPTPAPSRPAPQEPNKTPERVPANSAPVLAGVLFSYQIGSNIVHSAELQRFQ